MSIGDNIKKLRESKGLSQVELGKIAGVSDKAVSTWENNIKTPRMGVIQKLSDYFGVSKSDIIEDVNVQQEADKRGFSFNALVLDILSNWVNRQR